MKSIKTNENQLKYVGWVNITQFHEQQIYQPNKFKNMDYGLGRLPKLAWRGGFSNSNYNWLSFTVAKWRIPDSWSRGGWERRGGICRLSPYAE